MFALGTSKFVKFCDKLLTPIATNEYAINDSFSFRQEIKEFDINLVIVIFDVKSLFTNIDLTETIALCVQNLYRNQTHIDSLSKNCFRRLLEIKIFESCFIFDQSYYKQCNGVGMSYPMGLIIASVELFNLVQTRYGQ